MFGTSSYLISIIIFAGIPVVLELLFGWRLLRKYMLAIVVPTIYFLLFTPTEAFALRWQNWLYDSESIVTMTILGAQAETYVFSLFVAVAVSGAVITWSSYEDRRKSILRQSVKDVVRGTYAIWRKR